MVKHSGQKHRGIRPTVQRHSIRVGGAVKADGMQSSFIFSKQLKKMVPLARDQWHFLRRVCSKWSFIPVAVDQETGIASIVAKWKNFIHYVLAMMYGAIMSYKLYITIHRVAEGKLDLVTYMCACSFIVLFNGACATVGSTWLPRRMCDLFNSWKSLQDIVDMKTGRGKTVFDDKAVSIKVLFLVVIIHLAAINASMFSFVGEVPACVLPTLKRMGWLDLSNSIPPIVWSLVFFPLELLTLWPPMLATGVCAISIVLGLGMFRLFANEIRKDSVLNMNSWTKVYRQYRIMQVYNAILMDWMKNVLMAALVSSSCGVILLLYVTIRPSDLPFLIYIWFPIVAVLLMITTTWIVYDAVVIKRTVEEVVWNLESGLGQRSFMKIDARGHAGVTRMLKSLRPAALAIGEFSEASLMVPMNMWDEVLNQLVFLLSL